MTVDFDADGVREALGMAAMFYTATREDDTAGAMSIVTAMVGAKLSAAVDGKVHPPQRLPKTASQFRKSVADVMADLGVASAELSMELVHALALTLTVLAETRQCTTEDAVAAVLDRLQEVRS